MPSQPSNGGEALDYSNWKALKRELSALDIVDCDNIVRPEEYVKTKHHCYVVKEYANGGTVA